MNRYYLAFLAIFELLSNAKGAKDAAYEFSDWLLSTKEKQLAEEHQAMLLSAFASIPDIVEDGKTTARYGEMEAALMRQGRELPIPYEQIAALFKAASQLGYSSPEEFEAFTSTAGKASVAFGASPEAMSAAMGGYGKALKLDLAQSKSMFDLLSLYHSTGAASGAVTAAIIGQLKNLRLTGPEAAKTATALAATLGKQGAAPEDAAKSIKNIFSVLGAGNKATEAQKAAFAELGLNPVELAEKMKTSSSATVLELLKSIAALAPERKESVARALLGEQGAEGVDALLNNPDGMAQLRQNMDIAAKNEEYREALQRSFEARSVSSSAKKAIERNVERETIINDVKNIELAFRERLKDAENLSGLEDLSYDRETRNTASPAKTLQPLTAPKVEQKPSVADTAQAVNPPFKAAAGKNGADVSKEAQDVSVSPGAVKFPGLRSSHAAEEDKSLAREAVTPPSSQKPSVADTAQAVNPPFKAAAGKSEEGETTSGPSLRRAVTPPGDAAVNSGKTAVTPPGNADVNSGKTNERPGKSGVNNGDADTKKPSIMLNEAKLPSREAVTPPFPTIEDKKRGQEGEAPKQNSAAPAGQNGPAAPAGAGGTITERQAAAPANANDPGTKRHTDSTTASREAYEQKPSVADTAQAVNPPFKSAAGKSEEGETTSGPSLRRAVTPPGDADVNSGKTAVTPPSNANANSGKTNERPGKSGVNNGDADTKKPSILLNEAKIPSSEAVTPPFPQKPSVADTAQAVNPPLKAAVGKSEEGEAQKQNSAAPAGAGGTITERQAAAAANANANGPGTERNTDSTTESREAHRQRASELLKSSHSATERRNDTERHSDTERRNTGTERHSATERQSTTERHTDSTSEHREGYEQKPSVADTAQAVNPPFKATATAATAPFPTIEDKKRGQEGEAPKQNSAAPEGQNSPAAPAGASGTITERQAAAAANANANGPVTPAVSSSSITERHAAVSSDSETERHTDSTTASRKISALFQSSHSTEARSTDTERHTAAERHSVNTGQKPSVADTAQAVNPPFKAVVAKSEEGSTTKSLSPEGSLAARNGQGGMAGAGGTGAGGMASGVGGMASGVGGMASGAGGMASGAGGMPGAGVSATFNFTLNGIPEGDLARQIINVLDARKADIESLVSEIVNNQMRLAYGE